MVFVNDGINTYFYVEVLRMVFTIVESANAQLQISQLNFCKAQDIISCTKALSLAQGFKE